MGYRVINGVLQPIGSFPTVNNDFSKNKSTAEKKSDLSFGDILKSEVAEKGDFTISKHAADRLKDIELNNQDMSKINEAIDKANEKGAKNCLILFKNLALVTSVENRTIITAVGGDRMKENVFTNIDSVVLL